MFDNKWLMLQLFAGEGGAGGAAAGDGGGTGADTGANSADAGQQRLRELGVPEDKIRKNRAYRFPQRQAQTATASEEPKQQAAAAEEKAPTEENKPTGRMSWKEIMADPEYNQEMQKLMKSRLREANGAQEAMATLTPALEAIAKHKGLDPAKLDYKALAEKILDDDSLYEQTAVEMGLDNSVAKRLERQKMQIEHYQRQEQMTLESQKANEHIRKLEQQAQALKERFPNIDLRQELQNPVFARMTSPGIGLSVEDAYYAVHRQEIQSAQAQVIASQTAKQISNAIQANARRPDESGGSQAPSSVQSFDYRKASKAERDALKKRIRDAGARGEKVYPGR